MWYLHRKKNNRISLNANKNTLAIFLSKPMLLLFVRYVIEIVRKIPRNGNKEKNVANKNVIFDTTGPTPFHTWNITFSGTGNSCIPRNILRLISINMLAVE